MICPKKSKKIPPIFSCLVCDLSTSNKKDYGKHILTAKHRLLTNPNGPPNPNIPTTYQCVCGKKYKHKSSLCSHRRRCTSASTSTYASEEPQSIVAEPQSIVEEGTPVISANLLLEILKETQEFKQMMIAQSRELHEQNKRILEIAAQKNTITNHTTNHTTNHNQFNLNFFLNNTCKDALSINDFIRSLNLQVSDLEETGKLGFVNGITRIIVSKIEKLALNERPLHCTDIKREILYVKDEDKWEKDDANKSKLKDAVERVKSLNFQQLRTWQQQNPAFKDTTTKENDMFIHLSSSAIGGSSPQQDEKNLEKIMKNVLKEVVLDKK